MLSGDSVSSKGTMTSYKVVTSRVRQTVGSQFLCLNSLFPLATWISFQMGQWALSPSFLSCANADPSSFYPILYSRKCLYCSSPLKEAGKGQFMHEGDGRGWPLVWVARLHSPLLTSFLLPCYHGDILKILFYGVGCLNLSVCLMSVQLADKWVYF